jgi:hypothetical protein
MSWFYVDIIKGIFFIVVGLDGLGYYFGLFKYNAEKEEKRKERVEKYGLLLLLFSIVAIGSGIYLILLVF